LLTRAVALRLYRPCPGPSGHAQARQRSCPGTLHGRHEHALRLGAESLLEFLDDVDELLEDLGELVLDRRRGLYGERRFVVLTIFTSCFPMCRR